MKKTRLNTWGEGAADRILRRRLEEHGYRILVGQRLSSVLGKHKAERLPDREFMFYKAAELDFVVYNEMNSTNPYPLFAIEFDGHRNHRSDATQIWRDVTKNRMCRDADLPLFRISYSETNEKFACGRSILDYICWCHLMWKKSMSFMEEETSRGDEERHSERLAGEQLFCIQTEQFPLSQGVVNKLWKEFGIETQSDSFYESPSKDSEISAQWVLRIHQDLFTDETLYWDAGPWTKATTKLELFSPETGENLVKKSSDLKVPWGLALDENLYDMDRGGLDSIGTLTRVLPSLWCGTLDGVYMPDVAQHCSEYGALRFVGQWADANLTRL